MSTYSVQCTPVFSAAMRHTGTSAGIPGFILQLHSNTLDASFRLARSQFIMVVIEVVGLLRSTDYHVAKVAAEVNMSEICTRSLTFAWLFLLL